MAEVLDRVANDLFVKLPRPSLTLFYPSTTVLESNLTLCFQPYLALTPYPPPP